MRPGDGGANFGWRVLERTLVFTARRNRALFRRSPEYSHGGGARQGNSITGGYVYRGPVEALRGQYIFADFVNGNLWSFPVARVSVGRPWPDRFILRRTGFAPMQGAINNISGFGVDRSGTLYIVDFDGEIFRIEPA